MLCKKFSEKLCFVKREKHRVISHPQTSIWRSKDNESVLLAPVVSPADSFGLTVIECKIGNRNEKLLIPLNFIHKQRRMATGLSKFSDDLRNALCVVTASYLKNIKIDQKTQQSKNDSQINYEDLPKWRATIPPMTEDMVKETSLKIRFRESKQHAQLEKEPRSSDPSAKLENISKKESTETTNITITDIREIDRFTAYRLRKERESDSLMTSSEVKTKHATEKTQECTFPRKTRRSRDFNEADQAKKHKDLSHTVDLKIDNKLNNSSSIRNKKVSFKLEPSVATKGFFSPFKPNTGKRTPFITPDIAPDVVRDDVMSEISAESSPIRDKRRQSTKARLVMKTFDSYDDLVLAKSNIHGLGIFTPVFIDENTLIMEYKGEIIGKCMSDKREKMYKMNNIDSIYMFSVSEDMIIDATMMGNKARYINHSCCPNCEAIHSMSDKSIKYCSIRNILPGEELTIDYNMAQDINGEACNCGASKCKSRKI